MQMNKPRIAALLEAKLSRRHLNILHEPAARLDIVGVFIPPGAGNWYLGVRIVAPRRRAVNVRIHESRVGVGVSIFAVANFMPFDWGNFSPTSYIGDKHKRNERLHERVKREREQHAQGKAS